MRPSHLVARTKQTRAVRSSSCSVDGGDFERLDLFHRFSGGLHYPRTVIFAAELADGPHEARLRLAPQQPAGQAAARILQFALNARA